MLTPSNCGGERRPENRAMSDPARHHRAFAASTALLILLGAYSASFAQQTSAAGNPDESLAEKVNDPTGRLTQFKVQDIYTPAEYGTNAQPNTLQIRPVFVVRPQLFTPLEQLIRPTIQVVTVPRNKGASTTTARRMNLRHAAALALVGWYLIVPPLKGTALFDAPSRLREPPMTLICEILSE